MNISISEFSAERNIDRDTVNAWIRKHDNINRACIRKGKDKLIDTDSEEYKILEKQYPLPAPIEVIEDTESRRKLIQAQELIVQLQSKMLELQEEAKKNAIATAQAETQQILLEDRAQQIEHLNNQLEADRKEREQLQEDIKLLQAELFAEKNKSWLDKLFKK